MIHQEGNRESRLTGLLGLILAFGTVACYWPARHFEFINWDDPVYVYGKRIVQNGLTWQGFKWAFQTTEGANWNPLIWISHMADAQLYGPNPGGHHLTNVFLHAANTIILFLTLRMMTGALWRSAFVAAIFAWHPMHVESVAWVSERKDVLSTFFFLLALCSYARFVKAMGLRRKLPYALSLFLFVLGLMSKPMVVTLPLVLLLLDYWPVQRTEPIRELVIEKVPFLILSMAMGALTIWTQKGAGAMEALAPLLLRLENAAVSCVRYVEKLFWPTHLAIFYPFPDSIPAWQVIGAVLLLVVISWVVIQAGKKRRYLITGWFWFLITLAPVIGVIQVGMHAWADRFTYIPYIGLAMLIGWGLADVVETWPHSRMVVTLLASLALVCCFVASRTQLQYWRNNFVLYEHALKVTDGNFIAHSNLAEALLQEGKTDEAAKHFREVIRIKPDVARIYDNLGDAYALQNKPDDALAMFLKAVRLNPGLANAHFDLGIFYLNQHQSTNAVAELQTAARLEPHDVQTQERLADALMKAGRAAEAIPYCQFVVQKKPDDAHAHFALAMAYMEAKQPDEAIVNYKEAVRLAPDVPQCLNALAWMYATAPKDGIRNGPEAVRLATQVCEMTKYQDPNYLDTLAAAYAEAGRFDDAIKTTEEISTQARTAHDTNMEETARQRLELYKAKKPYRDGQ